jgi:hypothetical protein
MKRARQNLFPLRRLKRFGTGSQILKMFYSCTIEIILTGYITVWYGNISASDRKALLPSTSLEPSFLQSRTYIIVGRRKAHHLVRGSSHPSNRVFSLLPHGKKYRNAKSRT